VFAHPGSGNSFEGVEVSDPLSLLLGLLLGRRVNAIRNEPARLIPLLTGSLERNIGVDAERKNLLSFSGLPVLSGPEPVLQPPPFVAGWVD